MRSLSAIRNTRRHRLRDDQGWQMVEMLISVVIMGFVMSAVFKGFGQMLGSTSTIQNQIAAADIATQILDNARNQTYGELLQQVGTHELVVNNTGSRQPSDAFPRALMQDQVNLVYTDDARTGRFRGDPNEGGRVTETVALENGYVRVSVNVQWQERGGTRQYLCSTIVTRNGIHN